MPSLLHPARTPSPAVPIERTLALYYPRFVEWSAILTRGDIAVAEEIVQDLCLHLVVVRPDLSGVRDLDAYLYTSLRNMHLSHVTRAARERLRVVQVEDYDAVALAVTAGGGHEVDVQNELLRICHYVRRRKYASKGASHFILHFFWGYHRSDVALIARLPISAIYNKLRDTRMELHAQRQAGWTAFLATHPPIERESLRCALTTDAFLAKLRSLLLDAKPSECLDEEELLALYRKTRTAPVPNRQLAHLAGCASCLGRLERVLRLDQKDRPLDDDRGESSMKRQSRRTFHETMQVVQRRRKQLLEERPALLAIAVDGYVVASHNIDRPHSSLSTRIARIDSASFVEVFNERGSRLASLNVHEYMTQPIGQEITQKILLSDDRWLRLDVQFDDTEMYAEATYVDLALSDVEKRAPLPLAIPSRDSFWNRLLPALRVPLVSAAMAVAFLALMIFAASAMYRSVHPTTKQILAHAARNAEHPTAAEALYQAVHLELSNAPLANGDAGSVVVWRDADHRTVRQFYTAQHILLATYMTKGDGATVESREPKVPVTSKEQQILDSGAWKSDLLADDFTAATSTRTPIGFELTTGGNGRTGVVSRTLLLDRDYRVVSQIVRFRTATGISEVRMLQTALHRVSKREMPDGEVPQKMPIASPARSKEAIDTGTSSRPNAVTANLQVAILYELYGLHADTALPIEMKRADNDRIRLSGTVPSKQMLTAIRDRVLALPGSDRVDIQIRTASDGVLIGRTGAARTQELLGADAEAPAAALVQDALHGQGVAAVAMKHAEEQFAANVLTHAQAALQHAYALERLGNIVHEAGEGGLESTSRFKWAAMVEHHSSVMNAEMQMLVAQLDALPHDAARQIGGDVRPIDDTNDFYRISSLIRGRAQRLNTHAMELFGAGSNRLTEADVLTTMRQLRDEVPTMDVEEMMRFAAHLEGHSPASAARFP